ncbi:uncharacterized protein N7496_012637 [Penicillium cataractarum]|uniref:FAD-binding PCMH-type domain-containing protein n=1 Tax=Penicillium cataractarum TaxID=2100454 RepID=A0A9W9R9E8_9EURO|nr:uncharacterized protein N7496_012637 [Penicillium cataractarum]KAJ5355425.1 hypothetical protein N7496_012637 [Penicillium cataractarum]
MTTLQSLKQALRQEAERIETVSSIREPLTDEEYSIGFEILLRDSGWITYRDFVVPHLTQLLTPILTSHTRISVLEIGPGPRSVLGQLPLVLRRTVGKYAAYEPNALFATRMKESLSSSSGMESPLPCLEIPPIIHQRPFNLHESESHAEKFDVILFCHSMYGMNSKAKVIERALEMLVQRPEYGIVVVFHRDISLKFDGLACYLTASFSTGAVCVADDDLELDRFAPFVAGFTLQDICKYENLRFAWRKVCRTLGRRDEAYLGHLFFGSPDIMTVFTRYSTSLPDLAAQVPLLKGELVVKNREALSHRPACIVRPTKIQHIQQCVLWALMNHVGLTVIGGGHSGHCRQPNVVAVDMSAFDKVHIVAAGDDKKDPTSKLGPLVIAEAGCKAGGIVRESMAAGFTVPLGSRPSVGAGLWLQGGIGHLARLYGLSCDAIVGAIIVSVKNGRLLCVGHVPAQHRPAGAMCPEYEADLLWAIKGAGTNFGIVVSVVFKAYPATTHGVRNWVIPLMNDNDARFKINYYDLYAAQRLPANCSVDMFIYQEEDQMRLGVTLFENPTAEVNPMTATIRTVLGSERSFKAVDDMGLFETDMYMSEMHGGHGGNKMSSFKRCIFLKDIGYSPVVNLLIKTMKTRPTSLCYLHLLHGGGAVRNVAADANAFGYRQWEFACVITGIWPRGEDGTELAHNVKEWVYKVAEELLPFSWGIYSADLGPGPRDAALASRAFGPNYPRLVQLKQIFDPHNVLADACPLRQIPATQKLIILVTGENGVGKDYCANTWASVFNTNYGNHVVARTVCISDVTKREYAAMHPDVNLARLLHDRDYKEQHRPAMTAFFDAQVACRPRMLEEHFLAVVREAMSVDVLFITGMREKGPLVTYSHLVPEHRLIEVRVQASPQTLRARRDYYGADGRDNDKQATSGYCPTIVFKNEAPGIEPVRHFGVCYLLPLVSEDIQRLAKMVRPVPDFPRPHMTFQHVLGIAKHPQGLEVCTRLLASLLIGGWITVSAIACCETGGFTFASPLAEKVKKPIAFIREAGKLPPPTISVTKSTSHISASTSSSSKDKVIEMEMYSIPRGSLVVVVDDVLATGHTLCAVLELLSNAGIRPQDTVVLVVAEFPAHRGRELLYERGFGAVNIRSLLVFDGV